MQYCHIFPCLSVCLHQFCQLQATHTTGKMPKSFSHQDSRERICVACGIRTAKKKSVNNSEELLVRKYCKPNFDTTLREQPTGLCSNCRWYLFACKRGDNWEDIGRPDPRIRWDQYELEHGRFNEREHSEDNCSICELAKWNPVGEPDLNANKRYLMRSKATVPPEKKKFKFCPNCYQHTGPGIPHPPCTPAAAKKNLAELVSQLDTTGQQQVVSSSLKLLASSSNTEPGSEMRLTQLRGGNRLSVTLGKSKATKTTYLTSGFMASLQKKLNCSGRKIMMTLREFKKEGIKFEAGIRDPETTILSDVPLPELHLLMGVVNWAVELLYKLVPKEELLQRMRSKSISVHGYHGGGLDGGNSSQFLKNLDFLFEPLPDNLQPIHTMLTKFRQVVSSCFSMELAITFREDIDAFNESVHGLVDYSNQTLQIKLQPTWKIHILVTHLKPFLEEKMTGLGVFCEQTSEASHAVMKPTLQRFKRRSDHRLHGPKLLRACTDFSSKNM